MRRFNQLAAAAVLLLIAPGCVRERTTDALATYHYKWWVWVCGIFVPLVLLGIALAKHPTVWVNGKWRPWWKFRGWNYKDALAVATCLVLLGVAPFQLGNRVEVGPQHFEESNALGLRATRRIAWSDLRRIDVKSDKPAGKWTPDRDRAHGKKPDMVAVFKDNRTEVFRGALPMAARGEIQRRAQAAGVPLATTDDPGAAGAPVGAPWGGAMGGPGPGPQPGIAVPARPPGFPQRPGQAPDRPRPGEFR